jgi:hypothetical protein
MVVDAAGTYGVSMAIWHSASMIGCLAARRLAATAA